MTHDQDQELDQDPLVESSGVDETAPPTGRAWWIIGGLSAGMLLVGAALWAFGGGEADPVSPGAPGAGLAPTGDAGSSADADGSGWSPFFVKGGFSLFLGFCVGYALRTFFKISAVVIGLLALCLFGLSYAGVVEVDWGAMDQWFDSIVDKVREEASQFKSFMTGSLPSAALATAGLVAGFRRRR